MIDLQNTGKLNDDANCGPTALLTIYSFVPLIGVLLVAFAIEADIDWVPLWFKASTLPLNFTVEMATFTLAIFWVFYKNEKYISYTSDEQKIIHSRVMTTTVISLFFLALSWIIEIGVDFRELSQNYYLNSFYNIFRLLIIFYYFGVLGGTKVGVLMIGIAIGFFNVFSGSKGSMLTPILISLMVIGRLNARAWLIFALMSLAILGGLIPFHYIIRYLDPGFSAYQTAFIYYQSGIKVIGYHIETIHSALSGSKGYNPIIEYLNDTGLAAGYNLTPTIVGEMMGSGTVVGLMILFFITFYLWVIKRLWLQSGPLGKRYFSVGFFVLIGSIQSSLLDIVFYIPYFFIALFFVKIMKFRVTTYKDSKIATAHLITRLESQSTFSNESIK
jgi:hypothetical protein